jgi:hypothetical protein
MATKSKTRTTTNTNKLYRVAQLDPAHSDREVYCDNVKEALMVLASMIRTTTGMDFCIQKYNSSNSDYDCGCYEIMEPLHQPTGTTWVSLFRIVRGNLDE